jgi:hypothetical protein
MMIVSWVLRNHIPMILFILVGCRLELKVDRQLDVNLTCVGLLLWWSNLLLLCLSPSRQRVHGLVSFPGHKRAWRHVTCERVQGVHSARRSLLNVSRLMFGSVNMLRGGTPTFFFRTAPSALRATKENAGSLLRLRAGNGYLTMHFQRFSVRMARSFVHTHLHIKPFQMLLFLVSLILNYWTDIGATWWFRFSWTFTVFWYPLEKCCAVGAPERLITDIYMSGYKVLLLTQSNLIWVVKCMCVRCRLLKYVYGSSMRS